MNLINETYKRILLLENKKKLISKFPEYANEINALPNKASNWLSSRFIKDTYSEVHPIQDCFSVLGDYLRKESRVKSKYKSGGEYKDVVDNSLPKKSWENPNDFMKLSVDEMLILMQLLDYRRPLIDVDNTKIQREEIIGRVDNWQIFMPITRASSCVIAGYNEKTYIPKTTWCTARIHGSNLFYNYVAREDADIVLFYLIKDNANTSEDYLSVGYRNGQALLDGTNGSLSVDGDNVGLTEKRLLDILGHKWKEIERKLTDKIDTMTDSNDRIMHPVKKEIEKARTSSAAFKKFYSNQSGTESIDSIKLLLNAGMYDKFIYMKGNSNHSIQSDKYGKKIKEAFSKLQSNEKLESYNGFKLDRNLNLLTTSRGQYLALDEKIFSDLLNDRNIKKTSFFHEVDACKTNDFALDSYNNNDFMYFYTEYMHNLLSFCRPESYDECIEIARNKIRAMIFDTLKNGFNPNENIFSRSGLLKRSVGTKIENQAAGTKEFLPWNAQQDIIGSKFKTNSALRTEDIARCVNFLNIVFVNEHIDKNNREQMITYLKKLTEKYKMAYGIKSDYTVTDFMNDFFVPESIDEKLQNIESESALDKNKEIVNKIISKYANSTRLWDPKDIGPAAISDDKDMQTDGNYLLNLHLGIDPFSSWEQAKKASKNKIFVLTDQPKAYCKDIDLIVSLSSLTYFMCKNLNNKPVFSPAEILSYSRKFVKKYEHMLEEIFKNKNIDIIINNKYGGDNKHRTFIDERILDDTQLFDARTNNSLVLNAHNQAMKSFKRKFDMSNSVAQSSKQITGNYIKKYFEQNEDASVHNFISDHPKVELFNVYNTSSKRKHSLKSNILHDLNLQNIKIEKTEENAEFFEERDKSLEKLRNLLKASVDKEHMSNWNTVYWGELKEMMLKFHNHRIKGEEAEKSFKKIFSKNLNNSAFRVLYFENMYNNINGSRTFYPRANDNRGKGWYFNENKSFLNKYVGILGAEAVKNLKIDQKINLYKKPNFNVQEMEEVFEMLDTLNAFGDYNEMKMYAAQALVGDTQKDETYNVFVSKIISSIFKTGTTGGFYSVSSFENLIQFYEKTKSMLGVQKVVRLVNDGENAEYNNFNDYMLEGVVGIRFINALGYFYQRRIDGQSEIEKTTNIIEAISKFLNHVKNQDKVLYDILTQIFLFTERIYDQFVKLNHTTFDTQYLLEGIVNALAIKPKAAEDFMLHYQHGAKLFASLISYDGKLFFNNLKDYGLYGFKVTGSSRMGYFDSNTMLGDNFAIWEYLCGKATFTGTETKVRAFESTVYGSDEFVNKVNFIDYMYHYKNFYLSNKNIFKEITPEDFFWAYFKFVGAGAHQEIAKKYPAKWKHFVQDIVDNSKLAKENINIFINYCYHITGYGYILDKYYQYSASLQKDIENPVPYRIANHIEKIYSSVFNDPGEIESFKRQIEYWKNSGIDGHWQNKRHPVDVFAGSFAMRYKKMYGAALLDFDNAEKPVDSDADTQMPLIGRKPTSDKTIELIKPNESMNIMNLPFYLFSDVFIILYVFAYKNTEYRSLFLNTVSFNISENVSAKDLANLVSQSTFTGVLVPKIKYKN